MPYTDYISTIVTRFSKSSDVSVLEIGVGNGATLFALMEKLTKSSSHFKVVGIDVMIPESVIVALAMIEFKEGQSCELIEDNSLSVVPKLISDKRRFDVVMIDGDHNYYTVSQELAFIDALTTHDDPIVVLDDYTTKWGEKDMWYSLRPGYELNSCATKFVETQKHGVKFAVIDFLLKNQKTWEKNVIQGDFIVLKRV